MRGGRFIFVSNVSAQEHTSSKHRHISNFRVMVVRDIKLRTCLSKIYTYLGISSLLEVLGKVLIKCLLDQFIQSVA